MSFEFPFARDARVKRLAIVAIPVAMGFQHIATAVRQHYGLLAIAGDAHGLGEALLAQVPEVSVPWVGGSIVAVAEVADRDHAECADSRQGAALRAPEGVRALPRVVDDFAVALTRQVQATGEYVAGLPIPLARVAVTIWPSLVVTVAGIAAVTVVLAIPLVVVTLVPGMRRVAADRGRIIVIALAVVTVSVPTVALVAVVSRIEIHQPLLQHPHGCGRNAQWEVDSGDVA